MTFRVLLSETAVRQLRRLPPDVRKRIARGLRELGEDPFRARPKADIRGLEGTEPRKYRIRVGDYRAVYSVAGENVKVIEVFARGRGYR